MNEVTENKSIVHQGRNVKIVRESKGLYQKDLGYKINKEQSEISRIESQEVIEDELLEQIALALEVPVDFLKNFDLDTHANTYNNNQTNNLPENSKGNVNQGQGYSVYNYSVEEFVELTKKFLTMQKEHYEKEQIIIIESSKKDK